MDNEYEGKRIDKITSLPVTDYQIFGLRDMARNFYKKLKSPGHQPEINYEAAPAKRYDIFMVYMTEDPKKLTELYFRWLKI